MVNLEHIIFPVAIFTKDNLLEFSRDKDDLTLCSTVALKNGFYKNLEIIDSNGVKFISQNAIATDFIIWNWLRGKVRVRIEFEASVQQLDIDDVRNRILTSMYSNPSFWEAGNNFSELTAVVLNGNNANKIIKALSDFYFQSY